MKKCKECEKEFDDQASLRPLSELVEVPKDQFKALISDALDNNFCNKWCEKKWADDRYTAPKESKKLNVNVTKNEPFFNRGLGCMTYGTRDAEKKAKKMGLVCVGGEQIKPVKEKDTITPLLVEGIKKIRSRM